MAFDGRAISNVGVLAAIVEGGRFARAAEALGLSRSGVTRAVSRLEARIGVRLLDRTTRAVALTDEGRRLYSEVAPLLAGIEDAVTVTSSSSVCGTRSTARECGCLLLTSVVHAAYLRIPVGSIPTCRVGAFVDFLIEEILPE